MEAIREMVGQVAAQAKLTAPSAKKAIYLLTLAKDGADLERASDALGLKIDTVKNWCKRFDITLADYDPFPKDRFPIRPKPQVVLGLRGERSGLPLFGDRVARGRGRCAHQVTSVVEGKTFCCDCGKERKPKKGKGS
jgi:hypothetical protein